MLIISVREKGMKHRILLLVMVIFLGIMAGARHSGRSDAARDLRAHVASRRDDHRIFQQRPTGSGGTGSIIQQDGLILTNAHVVIEEQTGQPYPRLTIYLKPDHVTGDPKVDLSRGGKARVVAFSQPLDLALLKLEGMPGPFPVLGLDDSDRTEIGDRVVAIGHPEQGGLWTLTTGTISAEFDNFNATKGKSVFQTETGLNRGNSGGPLLDTHGRMIGVNTAIARVAADGLPITSISFSLKSNVAKRWLGEQGVSTQEALASSGTPELDKSASRSTSLPSGQTTQPANPPAAPMIASPSSPSQAAAQVPPLDHTIWTASSVNGAAPKPTWRI